MPDRPERARGPLVVAIDVGSSSIRAALVDRAGRRRRGGFAQVAYEPVIDDRGGVTVEPERLLGVLGDSLDAFVRRAGPDLGRVEAVGLSCFLHSLAGLDRTGRAVTPLLTWADTASAPQAAGLRHELDGAELWQATGCPLHASYWPAKIVRLRAAAEGRIHAWAGAAELLFEALTGRRAIDVSQASGTGLLDRHTGSWHERLLAQLRLSPAELPEIAPPAASARLSGWAATRWPGLAGIPWFVPWSDAQSGNVGLGCLSGGPVALQVGTSGALRTIVAGPDPRLPDGLFGHRLADGTALVGGQLSEGGGVVAAVARLLGRSMARLEAAAAALPPDGHGLTALPYLAGERGPGYHSEARGVLAGVSLRTSQEGTFLAMLESVAFGFATLDARLGEVVGAAGRVVAAGGALARSPLWVDVLAAALGREIEVSTEAEASTRGAALLALAAAGVIAGPGDVPPPAARRVAPDPERVAAYRIATRRQSELYRRLLGSGDNPARGLGGRARQDRPS